MMSMDDSNRGTGNPSGGGAGWGDQPGRPDDSSVWSGWDDLDPSPEPSESGPSGVQFPANPSPGSQNAGDRSAGERAGSGAENPWSAAASGSTGPASQGPVPADSSRSPYGAQQASTGQTFGSQPWSAPGSATPAPAGSPSYYGGQQYPSQPAGGQYSQQPAGGQYPQQGAGAQYGRRPQDSQPWGQASAMAAPPLPPAQPPTAGQGGGGRGRGFKAGVVVLVAVLSAGFGGLSGWAVSSQNQNDASGSSSPGATVTKVVQGNSSSPDWTSTASAVSDSVVSITVETSQGTGAGSGVVLDTKGDIVTNNHVVMAGGSGGTISVSIGDKTYDATVVGTDSSTDLAVIRLSQVPKDLKPITFGNSDKLAVGEPVMAIGNPLGLSGSVTTGIISALNRPVTTSADEQGNASGSDSSGVVVTSAIQTSAPINPGNSGGALVNADGQLIGINSSIASLSSDSSSSSQSGSIGIGFAIPANQVKNITDQLISSGRARHAYLGITTADGTATVAGVTTSGASVRSVQSGSPAAKAGIQEGDVIVTMNSTNVTSGESLVGLVRSRKVGEQVTLTLVRNGSQQKVKVTLAAAAQ